MIGRKNTLLQYRIVIFISILIIAFLSFWILLPNFLIFNISSLPELSTVGYVQPSISVDVKETEGIVKLEDKCYEMEMIVDRDQAISIENGINRIIGPRPNTHDLINDMLRNFDVRVIMVKIITMKNETCQPEEGCSWRATYFAKLFLKQAGLVLGLDSRPSDALAIAARTDYEVPIYLNESLLKTVGEKVC